LHHAAIYVDTGLVSRGEQPALGGQYYYHMVQNYFGWLDIPEENTGMARGSRDKNAKCRKWYFIRLWKDVGLTTMVYSAVNIVSHCPEIVYADAASNTVTNSK
jgi:hypothetical protein